MSARIVDRLGHGTTSLPRKRAQDFVKSSGVWIAGLDGPLECISEACMRIFDACSPTKNSPSSDNDEHHDPDLDDASIGSSNSDDSHNSVLSDFR